MTQDQLDQLNTMQQVLRGLVASLVQANAVNGTDLAAHLQAFANMPVIEPFAKTMLLDLAVGADSFQTKQAPPQYPAS
ncbi:hypothetical protein HQN60_12555 [Deefgea piscis]|uniref:Uncharacterized protein n=1 Tax=Deefgea piscis TaxID=2739061 RepID=A0A6M8SXZ3_9NEIS|nr:hypothetical protein [Deefgea piscis]QKJ67469.1 hypothetical protein HQN60_12555 [Deefgea piscis]